jgi:LPXTG-site transpeptidase (sortase) family protein
MQFKQHRWYAAALVILFLAISVGVGGYFWGRSLVSSPKPSLTNLSKVHQTPEATATPSLNMADNVHLIIPKIGVDAQVEPVHVLANGILGVPTRNQWEGVGWYQGGPIPGQRGSAVIDGHLDRPGALPAVFWRLHELSDGDMVTVEEAGGHTLHFQVTKVASYPPDDAPTAQIFGDSSGTFLNLITCAGQWIPEQQQTSLRLVVYTKLVQ